MPKFTSGKFVAVIVGIAVVLGAGVYFYLARRGESLGPHNPVALTIWHNPSGQTHHAMTEAVERFNRTVGQKTGVTINVTSVGKYEIFHEKLEMISRGDPAAPEPPDIVIAYPKSAVLLVRKNMLVNFDDYFSGEDLARFIPRFIEEGRLVDGGLYVFPIGKSTEALFVNRTLFDRFAAATGTRLEDLATVEGLVEASRKYYEWTNARTPAPGDGLEFFSIDNPFNFAQVGFAQLGEEFFSGPAMNLSSPVFRKIWDAAYIPMARGWEATYDGFGSDLTKAGFVVCWTGTTASITFLPTLMNYPDNTKEPVSFDILPYPVYRGGRPVAIQRAGGFCLFKSTPLRERAAILFLRWLTAPEENLRYLGSTGYLPVTREAMQTIMSSIESSEPSASDSLHGKFLALTARMDREYDFHVPKLLDNFGEMEIAFETRLRRAAATARERFHSASEGMGSEEMDDASFAKATAGDYERFISR